MNYQQVLPNLWKFEDSCNVYVVKEGDHGVAVDFGSGEWVSKLPELGIKRLDHVFLTHHHADQCFGLANENKRDFVVHAPVGEERFLDPDNLRKVGFDPMGRGCPTSYATLEIGVPDVHYDMAGFGKLFWRDRRIRFLLTPGHGPNAISIIMDHAGRQIVFCGDAAYDGGTIWQPYHMEDTHWRGDGFLAAWEGIIRLHGIAIDALLPAHGPALEKPRRQLRTLRDRLMAVYMAKGANSPGEKDRYLRRSMNADGTFVILDHLRSFGKNTYLILSETGEALIVDPHCGEINVVERGLSDLEVKPTATLVSHYHGDHCDAVAYFRDNRQTVSVLHESIADAVLDVTAKRIPFLPRESVPADVVLKGTATWRWNEYEFLFAHWPGQTWWHNIFSTTIDGCRVAFAGDSFQPSSLWNGTGGFCAYNNSRFQEGFARSAQYLLDLNPDLMLCGHGGFYEFHAPKFNKIIRWADKAEKAVRDLCPNHDLENEYYDIKTRRGDDSTLGKMYWAS